MEKEIKRFIRDSLYKSLVGLDKIDTILNNDALVEKGITGIMALDYNDCDIESAARDIYEMKSVILGDISIEEIRAFLCLVNNRFTDGIMAYIRYCLGNLILISKSVNSRLSDKNPLDKAALYSDKTNLPPTRQIIYGITRNSGWGVEQIKSHFQCVELILAHREQILDK